MTLPTNQGLGPADANGWLARERKLASKRFNERVKLLASSINTIGLGIAGSAVVIPLTTSSAYMPTIWTLIWFLAFLTLHCVAQALYGLLRSED